MNFKVGDLVKMYDAYPEFAYVCLCSNQTKHFHLKGSNKNIIAIFLKKENYLNKSFLYIFLYKNSFVGRIKYKNETDNSLIDGVGIEKLL